MTKKEKEAIYYAIKGLSDFVYENFGVHFDANLRELGNALFPPPKPRKSKPKKSNK